MSVKRTLLVLPLCLVLVAVSASVASAAEKRCGLTVCAEARIIRAQILQCNTDPEGTSCEYIFVGVAEAEGIAPGSLEAEMRSTERRSTGNGCTYTTGGCSVELLLRKWSDRTKNRGYSVCVFLTAKATSGAQSRTANDSACVQIT